MKSIVKRTSILAVSCVVMLAFRLYINGRGSPFFNESDNPAAFSPLLLTRLLTFSHLVALNLWLLLCPSRLCFDWSMGSIPLVESLADGRNVATAAAFASLAAVLLVLCELKCHLISDSADTCVIAWGGTMCCVQFI